MRLLLLLTFAGFLLTFAEGAARSSAVISAEEKQKRLLNLGGLLNPLQGLLGTVVGLVGELLNIVLGIVKQLLESLKTLPGIGALLECVLNLVKDVGLNVPNLIKALQGIVTAVVGVTLTVLGSLLALCLPEDLLGNLLAGLAPLVSDLGALIGNLVSFLGIDQVFGAIQGLLETVGYAVNIVLQIVSGLCLADLLKFILSLIGKIDLGEILGAVAEILNDVLVLGGQQVTLTLQQ